MPRFTLFRAGKVERSLVTEAEPIRLGRLSGLEIVLGSPTVSREHARIRRENAYFLVEDTESINGVRLNGKRIKCHVLAPGDSIEIEDFRLVFEPPEETFVRGLDPELQAVVRLLGNSDTTLTFLNVNRILSSD